MPKGPKVRKASFSAFRRFRPWGVPAERPLAVVILLALLLAPLAEAHINGARPLLQPAESDRLLDMYPTGIQIRADLQHSREPLRNLVTHIVDPGNGVFYVEHREDPSIPGERFYVDWRMERFLEFRDANVNGLYEPSTDTVVRSWPLAHYDWRLIDILAVQIADVSGTSAIWGGNLTGAPRLRIEVGFTGKAFSDEGAMVRPQDIIVYMDVTQIPVRDLGSLHALEMTVGTRGDTALAFHAADNTSTALLADAEDRRGLFVWGGEAFLDGREQRVEATLEDERVGEAGNKSARFVLHMPTLDSSMRFVFVTGIEYLTDVRREPAPWVEGLLLTTGVALLLRRRGPSR